MTNLSHILFFLRSELPRMFSEGLVSTEAFSGAPNLAFGFPADTSSSK